MAGSGLIEPERLLKLLEGIEPQLCRFPAVDRTRLKAAADPQATDMRDFQAAEVLRS